MWRLSSADGSAAPVGRINGFRPQQMEPKVGNATTLNQELQQNRLMPRSCSSSGLQIGAQFYDPVLDLPKVAAEFQHRSEVDDFDNKGIDRCDVKPEKLNDLGVGVDGPQRPCDKFSAGD